MSSYGSQIFRPYRALGLVTESLPLAIQHHRTETFVTASLGKSYHLYDTSRLKLLFVGGQHPRKIRGIVMYRTFILTAAGSKIFVWKRGRLLRTFEGHTATIYLLYHFGDVLISVARDNSLKCWNLSACKPRHHTLDPLLSEINFPEEFKITSVVHPNTYLNKILVGAEDGTMQLWNIKTKKLIYEFGNDNNNNTSGGSGLSWGAGASTRNGAAITCLEQSTAIDVVGVGLANGQIVLHHLKVDKTLFTFDQASEGKVTTLSFRTDGHPILVSGTESGRLILWDLEKRKILTVMKNVHSGPILSANFFSEEPVMITSGRDNALKVWIFDHPQDKARLLRERSGHSALPTRIRFYGHNGHQLLSAGLDRSLRFVSTIFDHHNREFSQGHRKMKFKKAVAIAAKQDSQTLEQKLTPIIDFDACPLKEKEWDNVATCHADDSAVYSWSYERRAIGQHVLSSRFRVPVRAVAISTCGNFVLAGNVKGNIEKFNIQSGAHRGTFIGHRGAVTGLATDFLNTVLISASLDGTIKLWDFAQGNEKGTIEVGSAVTQIVLYRENSLLAVAADDLVIRIYDIEAQRLVRIFRAHTNQISDMSFSSDGRQLVSGGMDGTVCVWDVPAGRLIDWFTVESPVKSLAMSPAGDFLATTHIGHNGIFLWSNQMHFGQVFLRPVTSPAPVGLPPVAVDAYFEDEEKETQNQIDSKKKIGGNNNNLTIMGRDKEKKEQEKENAREMQIRKMIKVENIDDNDNEEENLHFVEDGNENENENENTKDNNNNKKFKKKKENKRMKLGDDDEISLINEGKEDKGEDEENENENEIKIKKKSKNGVEALGKGLITFSAEPHSRWQAIPNLSLIKERNKPLQPPKKPEAAPFILPTLPGLEPSFVIPDKNQALSSSSAVDKMSEASSSSSSRIFDFGSLAPRTKFLDMLDKEQFDEAMEHLKGLTASGVELEFRMLSVLDDCKDIKLVLAFLRYQLASSSNFGQVQAFLNLFLKVHGDIFGENDDLAKQLEELKEEQRIAWVRLQSMMHNSLCLLSFFQNIQ